MSGENWPDKLEAPRQATLACARHDLADAEAARAWLAAQPGRGWVCTVDEVRRHEAGLPAGAIPLYADLTLDAHRSAALRFDGTWTAWTYEESDGDQHRWFEERRIDLEGGGVSHYRVYWRLEKVDEIDVWAPFAARLTDVRRGS